MPEELFPSEEELTAEVKEPRKISSEAQLRMQILEVIDEALKSGNEQFRDLVGKLGISADTEEVIDGIINAISTTERGSSSWSYNPDPDVNKVKIGYYNSDSKFFGSLFHEVGHYLVGNLNESAIARDESWNEDKFCWSFSRGLCDMLEIEYDDEIERLCLDWVALGDAVEDSTAEEINDMHSLLVERDRKIRGISTRAGDEFCWSSNGRPILSEK